MIKERYVAVGLTVIASLTFLFQVYTVSRTSGYVRRQAELQCLSSKEHLRNLNDWVSALRANDELLVLSALPDQKKLWAQRRIRIFGDYLYRESRPKNPLCPPEGEK